MRMKIRDGVAVAVAIVGLSAMAVAAEPEGANSPMAPPAAQTEAGPANQQNMEARVNQHIKDLHAKLQITAAEEPQWQKFAQTMRANARNMDQAFDNRIDQLQSMNALQNMASYSHIAEQHAKDVKALLPSFEALYASMPQSQKQNADQVFREDANRGAARAEAQHG